MFQVVHDMEQRMANIKMVVLERQVELQKQRFQEQQRRLEDGWRSKLAYRIVAGRRRFSYSTNRTSALNTRYTYASMKPEIKEVEKRLDPMRMKQVQNQRSIDNAKQHLDKLIARNLQLAPIGRKQ